MAISKNFTTSDIDDLDRRFQEQMGKYATREYCYIRRYEFLLQRMLLPDVFGRRYRHALEIGCGIGYKAMLLTEIATQVDGIDLDTPYHGFPGELPAAESGRRILTGIGCVRVQLTAGADFIGFLRERPSAYDLLVTDYVMEHIREPLPLYEAMYAALEPGGVAVHVLPNTHDALEQFVRLNLNPPFKELLRVAVALLRRRRRRQRIRFNGMFVPVTHSEFIDDYRDQFNVYRLENHVYPMIRCGFDIEKLVPTREHAYTVVARRPKDT